MAWFGALVALGSALVSSTAAADRRFAVQASVAEGAAIGDAGDAMIVRRAPMFADLSVVTWSTEDPDWWIGGGLRMEFESQTSFGVSLRVGLNTSLEILTVRPYVGAAAILAPLTLFGAEVGVDLVVELLDSFRLLGRVFADGYFLGDDLPQGSVIVAFSGALGVEVVF